MHAYGQLCRAFCRNTEGFRCILFLARQCSSSGRVGIGSRLFSRWVHLPTPFLLWCPVVRCTGMCRWG
jgi:hypothetical protein